MKDNQVGGANCQARERSMSNASKLYGNKQWDGVMGRGNSCTRLLQFLFQLYNRIDFFFFLPPFSLLHVFIICFSVGGGWWGGSLNPPAKLHPTFPCSLSLSWLINTQREDLCGQKQTRTEQSRERGIRCL